MAKLGRTRLVTIVSLSAAALAVVLVLLFARRMSDVLLPGASTSRVTSREAVEVVLRDPEDKRELRLWVPKAFMTQAKNRRGGLQRYVWIETRLPGLEPTPAVPAPAPPPGSDQYSTWLRASDSGIYIRVENNYTSWSDDVIRERWLRTYSVDRNSRSTVAYELLSSDQFGLTAYKSLACRESEPIDTSSVRDQQWQCRDTHREYYVSHPNTPTVRIYCDLGSASGTWQERQGCQSATSFRGFSVLYIFRHSQLHRWREFDAGVRRLLESFVVTESQH